MYLDFMKKYYPEGDVNDPQNEIGVSIAATFVQILQQCGDDLSRENLMKQANSIKNFELPLLLPGIKLNTSPKITIRSSNCNSSSSTARAGNPLARCWAADKPECSVSRRIVGRARNFERCS